LGQALEDGTVDLHVGMPLPERSGLVQRKIAEDDFKVLCRKGHPLIGRSKTISLDLFLSARHLAVVPGRFETGGLVDEVLATLGRTRRVVMQIPHFLGGPFIVARSDLLMTASSAWAREACLRLPLQMFEVPLKMPRLCIFMTWHERFSLDPAHQWLRDQSEAATVTIMEKPGSSRARAASDKGRRVRD
jgi:DNA-binding transcriptional LysR family regulator